MYAYKVMQCRNHAMGETELNGLADEGWRLVTILTHLPAAGSWYYYYFERPVPLQLLQK